MQQLHQGRETPLSVRQFLGPKSLHFSGGGGSGNNLNLAKILMANKFCYELLWKDKSNLVREFNQGLLKPGFDRGL